MARVGGGGRKGGKGRWMRGDGGPESGVDKGGMEEGTEGGTRREHQGVWCKDRDNKRNVGSLRGFNFFTDKANGMR